MATSQKPRKKKPSVSPAEKERRQAYRDQKELQGYVENALSTCESSFNDFLASIKDIWGGFTQEEKEELEGIEKTFRADLQKFREESRDNDDKVAQAIELAFKDNKVNIEKKLAIMQDVITYQEITERVLNYMHETDATLSDFTSRYNARIDKEATSKEEVVEEATIVEEKE